MPDASTACRFEQRTHKGGFIDVVIADAKTIVEQKSAGVGLDKKELRQGVEVTPFEQAKAYADTLPNLQRPDYIIVCNFTTFRVHDLNTANPEKDFIEFTLAEFSERPAYLEFLVDPKQSLAKKQEQVSIAAGEQIGRLHDAIEKQYVDADSEQARHSLNVLCVRLVFCLFAEDSGVFQDGQFFRFLRRFTEPHLFRRALIDLFEALDTFPADRDAYADPALLAFPYVNGGLFRERIEIPVFDEPTIRLLLDEVAEKTDWSVISPTIFGGVFESTLNPEVRRSGGMHYTSPENIHRAIDPLFLDELTQELERIVADRSVQDRTRRERLQRFQAKLGSPHFFDPAAGSGNFLTETYICLRRLENKVLSELNRDQTALDFEGATQLKVSVDQMHGIEINEFAVHVARTALWIAELQANVETASIVQRVVDDLPLRDGAHIAQGNALRMKSDYRNANTIVYNNFVWPGASKPSDLAVPVDLLVPADIRQEIEYCAQAVLDARREYAGAMLAELYDPNNDWLYPALTKAHRNLDAAVERAYGVDFGGDETKIVAHLFDLYAQVTTP